MTFDASLATLASLSDPELTREWWPFRGKRWDGYALYHALEEEQRAATEAPVERIEAARILSLAQSAFGELRGLLGGLDDALLDRPPAEGEWSLRETLVHTIQVERSYRANVQYSIARTDGEPILMPSERRPKPDPADTAGGALELVTRFAARRAETDAALGEIAEAALARPTVWSNAEVDVRFRLHRFASHIAEHTYQCEKTIRSLGALGGDARAIAMRIGAMRGLHERRTDPARLRELDAALEDTARLAIR